MFENHQINITIVLWDDLSITTYSEDGGLNESSVGGRIGNYRTWN